MSYELRQELHGHTGDVRCASVLSDGTSIVTGSRDRSVRLWSMQPDFQYTCSQVNYDHPHWVNAVHSLPTSGFVSGCHDHLIRIFDASCVLQFSLGGHTGPVSSLSLLHLGSSTQVLSGSWDGSARVWDLGSKSCVRVLGNHENIVCVLGLPSGLIVTGSTGMQDGNAVVGFRVRIFGPSNDQPIRVTEAHEGPVRCLSLCAPGGPFAFASASNDGSIVLYTNKGDFVGKMTNPPGFEGSAAFNFCVSNVESESSRLVAACDDCCARVWNVESSQVIDEIEHPSTVWWVCSLGNGDICTASGDGVVRLFSSDPIRKCSDDKLVSMYKQLAKESREAQRKKISPGVDVSTLTRIEDARPGASEQQVQMFNKNGAAYAYQWSAVMGTWVEIGPVISAPEGKTELDGEFYDKVVPVEIDDLRTDAGGKLSLKLGFNTEDNPYVVANNFIRKHELPDYYLEEIVQFINQQKSSAGVPTLSQGQVPANSAASVTTGAKPLSQPPPLPKQSQYFPLRDGCGIYFDKGNAEKAMAKIRELNSSSPALTETELSHLDGIVAILKQTSRYHATEFTESQIAVLTGKLLTAWSLNDRFPTFDLIRAVLMHPDGSAKLSSKRGENVFSQALIAAATPVANTALVLTSLRAACNMFKRKDTLKAVVAALSDMAVNPLDMLVHSNVFKDKDANVRVASSALLFNCANCLYHYKPRGERVTAVLSQCLQGALTLLSTDSGADDEGACKAMSCLGCIGLTEPSFVRAENTKRVAEGCTGKTVVAIWSDVREYCGA